MKLHRGRLIDHVQLRTSDLDASKRFYRAVFGALGLEAEIVERADDFYVDELYVDRADDSVPRTHAHLAFQAADRETVEAFYRAALAAGGRDNGAPGKRDYHREYYAAFVLDPDGNNIEAVYHGAGPRSGASVTVEIPDS